MTDTSTKKEVDTNTEPHPWADVGNAYKSINAVITDAVRQAILNGHFKPGQRLTEVGLAKAFNVSRNPVREALLVLEVEGIVEISPRRGARVALLSSDEIQEIIELRAEMEGMSARYAAARCTDEARASLRKLLEEGNQAEKSGDVEILRELNQQFHNQIAMAGKNRFLVGFMKTLQEKTQWIFANRPEQNPADSWKEHAAILEAVISADAELASVLAKRHVEDIGKEIARASEKAELQG